MECKGGGGLSDPNLSGTLSGAEQRRLQQEFSTRLNRQKTRSKVESTMDVDDTSGGTSISNLTGSKNFAWGG